MSFKEKEDTTNSILVCTIYPTGYMTLLCTKYIKNAEKVQAYACQTKKESISGNYRQEKKNALISSIWHCIYNLAEFNRSL